MAPAGNGYSTLSTSCEPTTTHMQIGNNHKVIVALVKRHIEDAAFYWAQHEASIDSPRLSLSELARFSDLLDAHLEGISLAGSPGWQPTLSALERWKQPGEAFVAAYAALGRNDPSELAELLLHVRAQPEKLLRGVISAIAWLPTTSALTCIAQWTQENNAPLVQVAALRAAALCGDEAQEAISQPLINFLSSEDAHVRAAACRVAALGGGEGEIEVALHKCLADPDMPVRAQAAISVARRYRAMPVPNDRSQNSLLAAETLWQCVISQVNILTDTKGWYRKQALRRLNRWVQHLAGMVPIGHPQLDALLQFMPPRLALRFIAYHGDPAHLPHVQARLSDNDTARYAGWVWQTITGVDLASAELTMAEPEQTPSDTTGDARTDVDHGLKLPDAEKVRHFVRIPLQEGQRHLRGQPLDPELAMHLLEVAPHAVRSIAAQYLQLHHPVARVVMRGGARQQIAALDQLDDDLFHSGATL